LGDPNEITASGPTEICPGEGLELSADAGGDEYSWSTGEDTQTIVVFDPGVYSVIIWDEGGCASVSNLVIVSYVPDGPPTLTLEGDDVFCEGGMSLITSSVAGSYDWSTGEDSQSIEVTETGDYWVTVDAACSDDEFESEVISIVVLDGPDDPVADDVQIGSPGTAILSATGENLMWYETENAEESVGEGDSYETDFFDDLISYWVEANTIHEAPEYSGAKLNNDGSGGIPGTGGVLFFDAYEPFLLSEVTVHVPNSNQEGNRTIVLYDEFNNEIDSYTDFFTFGEHQVPLNFEVPEGNGLSIGCNENNFFRNDGSVNYPYEIGDLGSVYNSTYGTSYYYYFYNWQVQGDDIYCTSDRIEVMATVVGVEEIEAIASFSAYPVPTSNNLLLDMELVQQAKVNLAIVDLSGKIVIDQNLETSIGHQTISIDVSTLASGVYMLTLFVNDAQIHTRIIIE
jgi:hypothetical protein